MKLKIRTLNNDECEVEVDESDSVTVLKTKVQEKFPSMESSKQKLIHTGKILQNELKISDYPAIKENDRVVVMVTKAAPPKSSTDLSSSSSSSSTASASTTPSSASSPSSSSTSSTPAPTPPVASEATSTSSVSSDTSPAADVATAVPAAASGATAATDSTTAPPRESGSVTATGGGYDSAASALVTGSQLEEVRRSHSTPVVVVCEYRLLLLLWLNVAVSCVNWQYKVSIQIESLICFSTLAVYV
eukprot:GHVQ01033525.1.p1 GENE.GHVQ01033525.1~~GHVQ01033525.1.p1  ORF type:complete len:246 (+),score=67.00 GHVQ01033525.1:228-965(+)